VFDSVVLMRNGDDHFGKRRSIDWRAAALTI
jgi:hypothetical protein